MRYLPLFTLSVLLGSCSSGSEVKEEKPVPVADSVSVEKTQNDAPPIRRYAEGMEEFTNMEWVEYCLPLPVYEYEETSEIESVKGHHLFVKKGDKKSYLLVKGLERSDKSVVLEDYFKNTYPDDEEDESHGKIIQQKAIKANMNSFYATGYYSNSIYESRFLEIIWLRTNDVVSLEAVYPVADTAQWAAWLVSWLTVDSNCR